MLVSKWGNCLAVRLPKQLVDELAIRPSDELALLSVRNRANER